MEIREMNRKAVRVMEEWDPFTIGNDRYAIEIADVIAQLDLLNHPTDLAKAIQSIYECSFGQWIPLENCVDVSYKLIALKFEAKCII